MIEFIFIINQREWKRGRSKQVRRNWMCFNKGLFVLQIEKEVDVMGKLLLEDFWLRFVRDQLKEKLKYSYGGNKSFYLMK